MEYWDTRGKTREFCLQKLPIKTSCSTSTWLFLWILVWMSGTGPQLCPPWANTSFGISWSLHPAMSVTGLTQRLAGISSRTLGSCRRYSGTCSTHQWAHWVQSPPMSVNTNLTSFRLLSVPLYGYMIKVAFRWLLIFCYWTITMNTWPQKIFEHLPSY